MLTPMQVRDLNKDPKVVDALYCAVRDDDLDRAKAVLRDAANVTALAGDLMYAERSVERLADGLPFEWVDDIVPPDSVIRDYIELRRILKHAQSRLEIIIGVESRDVSYDDAIEVARDLNEGDGSENPEYWRGQLELIADLWGKPGVFLADRKDEVAKDLISRLKSNDPEEGRQA